MLSIAEEVFDCRVVLAGPSEVQERRALTAEQVRGVLDTMRLDGAQVVSFEYWARSMGVW